MTTGVKYWLNVKFLRIFFCLQTVLRQQSVKQICAPPIWTGLSDFNICYSDALKVLSSVLFITQSDNRNIEYLISWLQKLCLEYLLFGWDTSLLNFGIATNFLNFRELRSPYFSKGFLCNLRPCFDIAFVKLRVIPRTKNRFVEILAVWECYLIANHVKYKEAAVPNMTSCKISWWKNISGKRKKLFALSGKIENLFHKDKLNMTKVITLG